MQDDIYSGLKGLERRVAAVETSTKTLEASIDRRIGDLVARFETLVAQFETFNANLSTMLKHLLEKDGRYERFVFKALGIITLIWGLKEIAVNYAK